MQEPVYQKFQDTNFCSFILSGEYKTTNLYKSNMLYRQQNEEKMLNKALTYVQDYTKNSKDINQALLSDNEKKLKTFRSAIQQIDIYLYNKSDDFSKIYRAVLQNPKYPKDNKPSLRTIRETAAKKNMVVVFRGSSLRPEEFQKYKESLGKMIKTRSFMSASFRYLLYL